MSESHAVYCPPLGQGNSSVFYVGAGLGIGGGFIGIAIFIAACFGLEAALSLSVLPLLLGVAGMALTVIGALRADIETNHVVGSIFINLFAIVGALLEMAAWRGWNVFFPVLSAT